MKRFGSSRPTACPEDGGNGLSAARHLDRAAGALDYGADALAAVRIPPYRPQ